MKNISYIILYLFSFILFFFVQNSPPTALYSLTYNYSGRNCSGSLVQIQNQPSSQYSTCINQETYYSIQTCNSTTSTLYHCMDSNCENCSVNATIPYPVCRSDGSGSSRSECSDSLPSPVQISSFPNYGISYFYNQPSCSDNSTIFNSYYFFIDSCVYWESNVEKLNLFFLMIYIYCYYFLFYFLSFFFSFNIKFNT